VEIADIVIFGWDRNRVGASLRTETKEASESLSPLPSARDRTKSASPMAPFPEAFGIYLEKYFGRFS
jgi:hypothetical protein